MPKKYPVKHVAPLNRFHIVSLGWLFGLSLMLGIHAPAFAQSGAPNLIQFHGRLVDPMTSQPITTPTQIRVQIIQGGTAEENPTTGRAVFTEQAEVTPDDPLSDARLKTNIQPLTEALDKLQQIRGVSYEWTDVNPSPAPREIGVIAQEVEAVFPELVKPWGDQGYKGVSYDGLTAVLLEGVKALKAENEALRAELESLRQMLDELKAEVKKSRP